MATWHQMKARKRDKIVLWHAEMWSVISDPMGGCTSIMLFHTRKQAEAYMTNVPGSYALPPGGLANAHKV